MKIASTIIIAAVSYSAKLSHVVFAFTVPPRTKAHPTDLLQRQNIQSILKFRNVATTPKVERDKNKCELCPDPADNPDLDRREAAFAMMGTLWSAGMVQVSMMPAMFASPSVSNAAYGEDAKMTVPNVMEGLSNRVNKQCLVESLGNRECLAYLDPDKKLYQSPDTQILLERLEKATESLASIPTLLEEKKWSKILGILTGPMGSLGVTLDKLSNTSDNKDELHDLEKKIKNDLYCIAAAAERKQGDDVLANHKKATKHIVAYASAL